MQIPNLNVTFYDNVDFVKFMATQTKYAPMVLEENENV